MSCNTHNQQHVSPYFLLFASIRFVWQMPIFYCLCLFSPQCSFLSVFSLSIPCLLYLRLECSLYESYFFFFCTLLWDIHYSVDDFIFLPRAIERFIIILVQEIQSDSFSFLGNGGIQFAASHFRFVCFSFFFLLPCCPICRFVLMPNAGLGPCQSLPRSNHILCPN